MKIVFDNGIEHILTEDEVKVLKVALKGALPLDIICSEEREAELNEAYKSICDAILNNR